MANLEKYTNIYADLAQGAYIGRKEGFMFAKLPQVQKEELKLNEHATFHFPNAKDAYGNDASTVYLQPDNTVKTIQIGKSI